MIVLEDQVVLILSDFDSSPQISRLKPAFENESGIIFTLFEVEWLQLAVIAIDPRSFLIKIGVLPRWTIRVVLSVIDRVFLGRQFYQIIFVNIGGIVSLTLLCGVIDTIIYNLFLLRSIVEQFFLLLSREFFAHTRVKLVNWLKILASLLKSGSISQKRLLNTCARQFYRLLPYFRVYILFVIDQTFEITSIIILLGQIHVVLPSLR